MALYELAHSFKSRSRRECTCSGGQREDSKKDKASSIALPSIEKKVDSIIVLLLEEPEVDNAKDRYHSTEAIKTLVKASYMLYFGLRLALRRSALMLSNFLDRS